MENEITHFFSNVGTRNDVRMRVVDYFSNEIPGRGKGELASKYNYYVELLLDENRVYLKRPSFMHNGFDFKICVENFNFAIEGKRPSNAPTHSNIVNDLNNKKRNEPEKYENLCQMIEQVYLCERDFSDEELSQLTFSEGYSVDFLIKTIKWLFIEQDIRYWNYSGRNMLWEEIKNI